MRQLKFQLQETETASTWQAMPFPMEEHGQSDCRTVSEPSADVDPTRPHTPYTYRPTCPDLASRPGLARASFFQRFTCMLPSRKHTDESLRATYANLQLPSCICARVWPIRKAEPESWLSTFWVEVESLRFLGMLKLPASKP